MKPQITQEFLRSIGVSVDDATYQALVAHFGETLENRIVDEVVDSLSEEQVAELSKMKTPSANELQAWLTTNVPDLRQIAQDEVDILIGELAEHSDDINQTA